MDKPIDIRILGDHRVLAFAKAELAAHLTNAKSNAVPERVVLATWRQLSQSSNGQVPDAAARLKAAVYSDEFVIAEEGETTYLTGNSERAVLFAVYHCLERVFGLRWIYPGPHPAAIGNGRKSSSRRHFVPVMERRGFVFETIDDIPYMQAMVDWLAKNKINEVFFTFSLWDKIGHALQEMIADRGLTITLGGHSAKFFINPAESAAASQADHPYTAKKQLDYADLGWQAPFFDRIADYCKQVRNLARISLWPEDIKHRQAGDFLGSYIAFTERLQSAFAGAGLDVEVEHIAYNAGLAWDMLERGGHPGSSSIETLYAYWGRDYRDAYATARSESDRRAYAALRDWIAQIRRNGRKATIFEYYSDHFMLSPLFPMLPSRIAQDIADYARLGIDGIANLVVPCPQCEAYPWQWNHGYNSYVFARALWHETIEDIQADYYHAFEPSMREDARRLLERLEQTVPALTSWNVPLFPARAVDPLKVGAIAEERRGEIVSQLQAVIDAAEPFLEAQQQEHPDHPLVLSMKHYVRFARLVREQWLEHDVV